MKLPTPMAFKYELLWLRLFFLLITIWSILYSLISARLIVKIPPEKKNNYNFYFRKMPSSYITYDKKKWHFEVKLYNLRDV